MANTDKNILITPNMGSSVDDPSIVFSGADSSTTAQNITLRIYPTNNGTLSFEGSAGQLFSITNNLSGTIYSVNDVSGIPSIEVLDDGTIKLAEYSGNVLIGLATDNGTDKLQIDGSSTQTGQIKSTLATGTAPFVVASTTAVANLNADLLDGNHASAFALSGHTHNYLPSDASFEYTEGKQATFRSANVIESGSGDQASLEVFQDNAGEDAFMQFHVSGDFAVYFGLDGSTNDLAVGGWSMGAVKHKVWHAGNDGSGSGLDADLLDGNHASAFALSGHTHSYLPLSGGTLTGDLYLNYASPTIHLRDTDHLPAMIHQNSNIFYVLRGNTNNASSWTTFDGTGGATGWPIEYNITNSGHYVKFGTPNISAGGNTVWHAGNDGSGSGLDADLLDGNHASAFALSSHTHDYVPERNRTDWNDSTVINNVVGQLSWKNYGNNHTIFDASNGTSPSGTAVNNTNPSVNWTATYPTLMGWNGSSTYGVRVDVCRYADSAGSAPASSVSSAVLGSGTANSTTYLRGDRTWATITAGATLSNDTTTNSNAFYPAMAYNATSGAWTTAYISSTKYYFNPSTGTLSATVFNSLSDVNHKKNITNISNASDIINKLNGVEFQWIDNNNKSSGVIAQEVEVVLPHLVTEADDGTKTVNYSGIIAYLIESNKELIRRIEKLENSVSNKG